MVLNSVAGFTPLIITAASTGLGVGWIDNGGGSISITKPANLGGIVYDSSDGGYVFVYSNTTINRLSLSGSLLNLSRTSRMETINGVSYRAYSSLQRPSSGFQFRVGVSYNITLLNGSTVVFEGTQTPEETKKITLAQLKTFLGV